MSRIEENENLTKWIQTFEGKQQPYQDSHIMNLNLIVSLLADISKSLAVIADHQGENRLHGKWDTEFINDGFVGCPFCRTTHDIEGDFHLNDLHYCVNCGAKLD